MGNSDSGTGITIEDLRSFDFERVLSRQSDGAEKSEARTCQRYSKSFVEETKLAASEGDQKKETICELFATLTSLWFYFNDAHRSSPLSPPDISKEHLELLKQFVSEIQDPELRARIADILWTLRIDRPFQFAGLAVDSYLDAAIGLDRAEASHDRYLRIERALQIAARLDKTGQRFAAVIDFIETELEKMKIAGILRGPAPLLRLLREQKQGDPAVYIPYATHLAEEFEKKNSWEGARAVWGITRDWHRFAEDDEAARYAERRAAMTYEPEAHGWMKLETNTHFKVMYLLEKGVVALRESGAPQDDIKRVHTLMLKTQASYDGYKTFSFSIDMSEPIESIKREFRERALRDCIYRLAAYIVPSSVASLNAQANELQAKNPLQYLINKQLVDDHGKRIGQRPGYTYNDSDSIDKSIQLTMHEEAKRRQQVTVFGLILPALEQINLDHHIRPNDLIEIVTNSPFVPPDRQHIFLRGLYHGFTLDFMVASSLLVPQIENSLRYVLQQQGVIVSTLDPEGIQEEYPLGRLLYGIPEVKGIFGEDLVFDLQGLLLERFGSNFRNRLAHGLVTDNQYMSPASAYAWGLVLHLCCVPLLARQSTRQNNDTNSDDNQETDDETSDSTPV